MKQKNAQQANMNSKTLKHKDYFLRKLNTNKNKLEYPDDIKKYQQKSN